MIISGLKILEEVKNGNIIIDPFDEKKLGPNSYNITLANKLVVYEEDVLDMKKKPTCREIIIPEEGLLLKPGELYLGKTNEHTYTNKFVPMIEGRSGIGRLGLFIHVSAGFGDVGYCGTWTFEIIATKPIIIYPNVEIAQIYYHTIEGEYYLYTDDQKYNKYSGKYNNDGEIKSSMLYVEFDKEVEK
ncbi:MAG: dCTP deaminase [Clostridiales bacterium GWE2_32_10]|nr:MAG: dCTP deaminase [Clostridiales bacterium GWE2_32_10]HBY20976.1 dCTP deaminase [Clostridiales bacterium]